MRLSLSIVRACVPLLAQPSVVQAFEAMLPYTTSMLQLHSLADIPRLDQMLAALDAAQHDRMVQALRGMRRAFIWGMMANSMRPATSHPVAPARPAVDGEATGGVIDEEVGAAYQYTLVALCRRAMELQGALVAGAHASCAVLEDGLPTRPTQISAAPFGLPSWAPAQLVNAVRTMVDERRDAFRAAKGRHGPRHEAAEPRRRHS